MARPDRIAALPEQAIPKTLEAATLAEAVHDLAADVTHFAEWAGRLHGQAERDRAMAQIGAALETIGA